MEPFEASHETHAQIDEALKPAGMPPQCPHPVALLPFVVLAALACSAYWTFHQWSSRTLSSIEQLKTPLWSIDAPANSNSKNFVRIQDTSYWSAYSKGILTSSSHLATQNGPTVLTGVSQKSRMVLAPHSVVTIGRDQLVVESGMVLVERENAEVEVRVAGTNGNDAFPSLEPLIGSIHDMQQSEKVDFSWPKTIHASALSLEFARDPSFAAVLFTQPASELNHIGVSFADRSPGPWFVRLRSKDTVLAYTAFNLVESQTPDRLQRLGRRWLTWRDRGLASVYRLEFSNDETFKNIVQSFQVRNREFDLTRVPRGSYFTRVTTASVSGGTEHTSRPLQVQVQDKAEILRAGLELNDPELKLSARGWKIVLAHDEVTRIREGFVILRESELRGVKVAEELFRDVPRKDYQKKAEILKSVIFELSRDESFANPERVRPDSQGELLPPALPLGILYARIRRLEKDGTLGSFGPASRLTTWLPAPVPRKAKANHPKAKEVTEVELKWDLGTDVAGFEIRLSIGREFSEEATTVVQTRLPTRKVPVDTTKNFFWTVTALNEFGQKISMTSDIQEVQAYQPVERKLKAIVTKSATRNPAMIAPLTPVLKFPPEDAVIVGGATAKKYGILKWEFDASTGFEIQIATDGDFAHIVEKAKLDKTQYALQGDLPEGALFWRVRKLKSKLWSESRRFELVYE